MFLNALPATSIECHQCVQFLRAHSSVPCFELPDRIIVICSLSSPGLFDLYTSRWGKKKTNQTTVVNIPVCVPRTSCSSFLSVREVGIGERSKGNVQWSLKRCLSDIMFLCRYNMHASMCTCKYSLFMVIVRCNWTSKRGSFDLLRALSREQVRNSSRDTLQRRAMLSSCFTGVRFASGLSNKLSS